MAELQARKLEIEVGLDIIKSRIEVMKLSQPKVKNDETLRKESANQQQTERTVKESAASLSKATSSSKDAYLKAEVLDVIHGEKMKRQKAEAIISHQQSMLAELQSQIVALRETEQINHQLQFSRTINALDTANADSNLIDPISSKAFMEETNQTRSNLLKTVSQSKTFTATSRKGENPRAPSDTSNDDPRTELLVAAKLGDTRLQVKSQENFKKGMLVLIGSGSSMECHRITGFGSLIIDNPLQNNHDSGSQIVGYKWSAHNLRLIERKLMSEYSRYLLGEELLNSCFQIAENRSSLGRLNQEYRQRPMMQHHYVAESLPAINIGNLKCNSILISPLTAAVIAPMENGVTFFKLQYSVVEVVYLFEFFSSLSPIIESEQYVTKDALLKYQLSGRHRSEVFQGIIDSKIHPGMSSLPEIVNHFADREGRIKWHSFAAMLTGRYCSQSLSESDDEKSNITDEIATKLLRRIFELADLDDDGTLREPEVCSIFKDLDGVPTDGTFDDIAETILGQHVESRNISLSTFLLIREKYSRAKETLTGGVRLHGKLLLHRLIKNFFNDGNEGKKFRIHLSNIVPKLPTSFSYQKYLPAGKSIQNVFLEDKAWYSLDDVPKCFDAGMSILDRCFLKEPLKGTETLDIAQICLDKTENLVITLTKDGIAHVHDIVSGQKLFQQRLMWCEPVSNRLVEGFEKFYSWRQESGLDFSDKSPEMRLNMIEKQRISSLLAKFSCDLSTTLGFSNQITIDKESGMIAVDCTIMSCSICFYEPISMRRIYRIKSPVQISSDVEKLVYSIVNGGKGVPDVKTLPSRALHGLLSRFDVVSERSLLFCQLFGSRNIKIVSMLTGEAMVEVEGHSDAVTCFSLDRRLNSLLSGSSDASVRVWQLDDICPLKSIGTLDPSKSVSDYSLQQSENRIAKAATSSASNIHLFRTVFTQLCNNLMVRPTWINAKIIGFYDGNKAVANGTSDQHLFGVEIVLPNSSVIIVRNRISLRDCEEVSAAPDGPPQWNRPSAEIVIGKVVALFAVDLEIVSIELARKLNHNIQEPIAFPHFIDNLIDLVVLPNSPDDVNARTIRQEKSKEILTVLHNMYHSDMDLIYLTSFVRKLHRLQEKTYSNCDRYLSGNRAAITSITLSEHSKLLLTLDARFSYQNFRTYLIS